MARYKLSRTALREVAEIISYLHREAGSSVADKVENRLFTALEDLAQGRAFGHRRLELATANILFHLAAPYFIVFEKNGNTIYVLHVIHSARDLRKLI